MSAVLLAVIGTAAAGKAGRARPNGPTATRVDWTPVGNAIGVQGKLQPDGVYKVGLPRSDLNIKLDGVRLKPSFALGSYLSFMSMGSGAMMMGDLVLTEKEIEPVMLKLEQGGIEVSALHNHLFGEKPTVMYMHVVGSGDPVHLATAAHAALALSHTPLHASTPKASDAKVDLDTAALDATIGVAGKVDGGVYKFSIAPKYAVQENGMTLPGSMGTTTGLAFQPLGHARAAITGDFALLATQVNPVVRALRTSGIMVTALHSHMLDARPTVFFMHFFATGKAVTLAKGLRAGLDAMK
ncbi:MAG: LppY/LpqO family protein [Gaiellaceae bacterium]